MRHPTRVKRVLCLDAWLFPLNKESLCDKGECPLRPELDLLFVDADLSFTTESRGSCCVLPSIGLFVAQSVLCLIVALFFYFALEFLMLVGTSFSCPYPFQLFPEVRKRIAGGSVDAVTCVGAVHSSTADMAVFVPLASTFGLAPKGGDASALLCSQSEVCCAFVTSGWSSLRNEINATPDGVCRGLSLREPAGPPR